MRQEKKNLHSTKPIQTTGKLESETTLEQESNTQDYFFTLAKKETGTTDSYITGIYPINSSCGNQYTVIRYNYDTNSTQEITTKTRNDV